VHIDRRCLSHIEPGEGTNRNERLHRDINKILCNSRYGVELGYALLACTFFHHNERIRAKQYGRCERPIEVIEEGADECMERFGLDTCKQDICENEDEKEFDKQSLDKIDHVKLCEKFLLLLEQAETALNELKILSQSCSLGLLYQAITQYLVLKQMEKSSK